MSRNLLNAGDQHVLCDDWVYLWFDVNLITT